MGSVKFGIYALAIQELVLVCVAPTGKIEIPIGTF